MGNYIAPVVDYVYSFDNPLTTLNDYMYRMNWNQRAITYVPPDVQEENLTVNLELKENPKPPPYEVPPAFNPHIDGLPVEVELNDNKNK